MEVLIKYCKKEHNIFQGCDTVQLGTLDYYREMDPDFNIADPKEATFQFTIAGNPLVLSIDQMGRLTDGRWTGVGDPNRQLMRAKEGAKIIKSVEFPNCYIFCTCRFHSQFNKKKFAQKFKSNYDSSYMITNSPLFTRNLAKILMSQLKLEDFSKSDNKRLMDLSFFDMKDVSLQVYTAALHILNQGNKFFHKKILKNL